MSITIISFEDGEKHLCWLELCDALDAGHKLARAEITDGFLYRSDDTLLSRAAWINGMGLAVKSATIFPGNPAEGKPMINGAVSLFSDDDGSLEALVDFHLVTKWKTAGDSLCAARKLARPDSRKILIVGAGTVGRALYQAYRSAFPDAEFMIWNRTQVSAEQFAKDMPNIRVATDLREAIAGADIITCATMSTTPVIRGEWLRAGQHLDLIGAYRPDMREADDSALLRARVFVDSLETTVPHIGELKIPIESGVIAPSHIIADYYSPEKFQRNSPDEITIFKNGGGAHLDLMTSRYILDTYKANI